MSRIDDLLKELAPHGVPHYSLSRIAGYSTTRVDADFLDKSSFVGVDNLLPNKGGRTDATHLPNTARLTCFESDDVLIGNIRPYLKKVWLADRFGGCSGDVLAIRIKDEYKSAVLPKFLYYWLSSDEFFAYNMRNAKGAKMPRGNKEAILNFRTAVPPLEAQREIVQILDEFAQLESELEEELLAELDARRRQNEHYRQALLTITESSNVVAWSTLGAISTRVSSGATPRAGSLDYYEDGTIPWLRTQEVRFTDIWDTNIRITEKALNETAAKWIPENCVIIAISGATAGRSAINRIPVTTNQHCCNFEIDPTKANFRYVFYWVRSQYEQIKALGQGARSDLNASIIKGTRIPLPPLDEQARIVGILNEFDSVMNDLSASLSAELAARAKQYDYYRDRLLSFKEAGA